MTRRRRKRLLLLILILLGVGVHELPGWSAGLVRRALEGLFQRSASVGAVHFRLIPFEAELVDVRVSGVDPTGPPSLEVPRMWVSPSLRSLFTSRVVLTRVRLQGPKIRIHAFPEGGDDIPSVGGGGGGGSEVRIHRLMIEGGEFELDHARVPLELDLPDFNGRLLMGRGGVLSGKVAFGPGSIRVGTALPFRVGTELYIQLDGPNLNIASGRIYTSHLDVRCSGNIHLAKDPVGTVNLEGPADLEELDRHVFETGFFLKGDSHFSGKLLIDGPRLGIEGRFAGKDGAFEGIPIQEFSSEITWSNRAGTTLKGLEVKTLGGRGTLNLRVPKDAGVVHLDAALQGVDAEGILMPTFSIGAAGIASAATGPLSLDWPKGHARALSGQVGLDLEERFDGRTPLSGRFTWSSKAGVQSIERGDFRTRETHVALTGRIEADDRTDLEALAESSDLHASDDLFLRIRKALGARESEAFGIEGGGSFQGRWRGTLEDPVYEGRFTGRDLTYLGVNWGHGEWAGVATSREIRAHSLVLRRGGSELWLDGSLETGRYGEDDGLNLAVRFSGWPATDFITAFSYDIDLIGDVTGSAAVSGRRSMPYGLVNVSAPGAVKYYGVALSALQVAARLKGRMTEVSRGELAIGGGQVTFHGALTEEGLYDGTAEGEGVDIGALMPSQKRLFSGSASGRVVLQGPLRRPRLSGRLTSPRVFLGEEGIGALEASFSGSGDGRVHIDGQCSSNRVNLALQGWVSAEAPYEANLRLEGRETALDPFVRFLYPAIPPGVAVTASGGLNLAGPLTIPEQLRGRATFGQFGILIPDYPVRNQGEVTLELERGIVKVKGVHLAGEGTDLVLEGEGAALSDEAVSFSVKGAADLRVLSLITRRVRGLGAARLSLLIQGRRNAPKLDGTLDLDGAGVRARGFPHGIEGVHGKVFFSETRAHFEGVKGSLGGGDVNLDGQAVYSQGRLTSFAVQGSGRNVSLRYPEGLRSVLDAELRFFGDASRQWLTGTIDVKEALYTKRYDVASELLSTGHALESETDLSDQVQYDLKVRVPGTLRINNNLAALQARADLLVRGTLARPVVLGRAQIEGGQVYFQGNTYVIQHGIIDFSDPQKIDPLFDIEAETRVRSYRVTLKMNGTLERVYPTLTSDPPLSAVQILTLLAGADETTVESLTQAQLDQAKLAATGAATLAAGRISEEVGLERGAERFFGLNRFSIDPSILKTGTGGVSSPTARLTVGKRVTPDLNVLYSVDITGTNERVLSVEYTLSDRFAVLLSLSQPGGAGFDVLLHRVR